MNDLVKLKKMLYGDETKLSEKFENFILRYFKVSGEFDIIKRPGSLFAGLKSQDDNDPDFKFKDKRTGKVFLVDCKWRSQWKEENGVEKIFVELPKISFYKKRQKELERRVFIALGIGVEYENKTDIIPTELYFFPVDMFANRPDIRKSYLLESKREHQFKYGKPKFFVESNDLK